MIETSPTATLAALRRALFAMLDLGLLGTGTELLLIGHFEDAWQWAPLALIAAGLLVLLWHGMGRGRASLRTLRVLSLLFVLAGFVGVVLHFQGNAEFEREMTPAIETGELVRASMTGATPALAPGTMILLGLLGLAYAFRHPALAGSADDSSTTATGPDS